MFLDEASVHNRITIFIPQLSSTVSTKAINATLILQWLLFFRYVQIECYRTSCVTLGFRPVRKTKCSNHDHKEICIY